MYIDTEQRSPPYSYVRAILNLNSLVMTHKEFEDIYNKYFWLIYKYSIDNLRDEHNAKDVVSYVFMKLWEKKPKFDNHQNTIGWLILVTKRRLIDFNKSIHKHRYYPLDDINLDITDYEQIELYLIEKGVISQIYKLVDSFTPNEKTIFNLFYVENITTPKIAQKLNLSTSTIRSYLQIIRTKIRDKIKKGQ